MQAATHLSRVYAGKRTAELLQDSRQKGAHVCDGHAALAVTIPEHVRETLNTVLTFFKHQAPLLQPVLASDAPPSKVTIQEPGHQGYLSDAPGAGAVLSLLQQLPALLQKVYVIKRDRNALTSMLACRRHSCSPAIT